jgi:Flp pilus assembly protein TadG
MKPLPMRSLRSNERGAAVIELALVAPVLALGIIGIVDMSNAYSEKLALEQGAQRAIEKIMQTTANDTVENTLATEAVCQVNGTTTTNNVTTCNTSPITTSNVTVTYRRECTNSGGAVTTTSYSSNSAYDSGSCASGTVREADYIQIALSSTYTPMFPIHFASFNGSAYPISATAGMRIK